MTGPPPVKLVVGLGNPGARYAATRHNVGFAVLERVAADAGIALDAQRHASRAGAGEIAGQRCLLLLPQTWMNRSGEAVCEALDAHPDLDPARDLLVVTDDLDLPLGRLRLRARGSAGGHNGLGDVLACLESERVPRLRVGIGRPAAGSDPIAYVLERFTEEERAVVEAAVARAAEAVACFVGEGVEAAMNAFNRADPGEAGRPADTDGAQRSVTVTASPAGGRSKT